MSKLLRILVLFIIVSTYSSATSRVNLNLSTQALEVGLDFDTGQFVEIFGPDTFFLGAHYLSTGDETGNQMASVMGFMEDFIANSEDFRILIGLKAVFASVNGRNYFATPIGGRLDWRISQSKGLFGATADMFFATAPLAHDVAASYFESRVGVNIEPAGNIRIFAEIRILYTNFAGDETATLFNFVGAMGGRISF